MPDGPGSKSTWLVFCFALSLAWLDVSRVRARTCMYLVSVADNSGEQCTKPKGCDMLSGRTHRLIQDVTIQAMALENIGHAFNARPPNGFTSGPARMSAVDRALQSAPTWSGFVLKCARHDCAHAVLPGRASEHTGFGYYEVPFHVLDCTLCIYFSQTIPWVLADAARRFMNWVQFIWRVCVFVCVWVRFHCKRFRAFAHPKRLLLH